jgi:hypothetical protein
MIDQVKTKSSGVVAFGARTPCLLLLLLDSFIYPMDPNKDDAMSKSNQHLIANLSQSNITFWAFVTLAPNLGQHRWLLETGHHFLGLGGVILTFFTKSGPQPPALMVFGAWTPCLLLPDHCFYDNMMS